MKKINIIHAILGERRHHTPQPLSKKLFAPTNIALCKYWGKRDTELNLPVTSSLSIALTGKGTETSLRVIESDQDEVVFNGKQLEIGSPFCQRLCEFLDLFRHESIRFQIHFTSNIPVAAGLASSASGFASVILALNDILDWQLSLQELSILARLGSGSACRSLWNGFVEWEKGIASDGMDSYGRLLPFRWQELCIGLLIVNKNEKPISSREAMERTKITSSLYSLWPEHVNESLTMLKKALENNDFSLLGKTAESNAMTMHAMMLSAWPPISYFQPETIEAMQQIWKLREQGLPVYFTQDAGPNLKCLFLQKDIEVIKSQFPAVEVLQPFSN
jgi:diphosphomevalonate decarboxylase